MSRLTARLSEHLLGAARGLGWNEQNGVLVAGGPENKAHATQCVPEVGGASRGREDGAGRGVGQAYFK